MGTPVRVSRQHPRGLKTQWETLPAAYPARELVRDLHEGQISAEGFTSHYLALLEERYGEDESLRRWVASRARSDGDITLLCFERDDQFCHRRVLARWLHERSQGAMGLGMLR